VKTAISLPDELFDAADDLARRLGVSRSALIARALERFLAERRGDAVTEALDRVYGRRAPGLSSEEKRSRNRALRRAPW
jgi:metal-responsive CopG/Arc/MetJ family transcriptional regulator